MQTDIKSWWLDFFLLTILLAILFGTALGNHPLAVPDEARYSEIPREMVVTGDYLTPRINYIKYFEKPPLFYWLQAGAIKLFGLSEWSLRSITALAALLGCLLVYFAARKIYDRRTGWIASLILVTSILYFVMGHFITIDMTLTFFLSGCLLSFLLGTREPPGKRRHIYMWSMYVFSALTTLTKGLIGVVFPGMIIFFWLLIFNDWRNLKTYCLPSGLLIWLLFTLPWHILVQLRHPEFFHYYIIKQHFERYLTNYADRRQPLWYLPVFLFLGFSPWIVFLPAAIKFNWPSSWQLRHQEKAAIFLMLWATLIYLFFQLSHSQLPPYVLPILPPLAILTAHYLASVWEQQKNSYIRICFLLMSAVVFLLAAGGLLLESRLGFIPHNTNLHYVYLSGILLLLAPLCGMIGFRLKNFKTAFIALWVMMALFLISFGWSYPPLEINSNKSLALLLRPMLRPEDKVLNYHTYYQDVPFYLRRRVIIVGWGVSELDFGIRHQNMQNWLITDQTLGQEWQGKTRMFMFMSRNDYNKLAKEHPNQLHVLGENSRTVLVGNK